MALFSTTLALQNLSNLRSKKAEPARKNFEYKDFSAYKAAGGTAVSLASWKRDDGKWLKTDRETANRFWKNAVESIIKNKMSGRLKPFEQVADFYLYTQVLVKLYGHETQWLLGAYYLVDDLADAYDRGVTLEMFKLIVGGEYIITEFGYENLKELLAALNVAIADYAITQFYRLINGEYRKSPRKGLAAWKFDKQFIISEQNPTAFPVYSNTYYTEGLTIENLIFNKRGKFAMINFLDFVFIPIYPDQYNSILTENINGSRYGQEARILAPLAMLYPNSYFYEDTIDNLPFSFAIKDTKFAKTLKRGAVKISQNKPQDRDVTIFNAYFITNRKIKYYFYNSR